jgi:general secretion pathway protein C
MTGATGMSWSNVISNAEKRIQQWLDSPRLNARFALLINLGLVTIIAWYAAGLTWTPWQQAPLLNTVSSTSSGPIPPAPVAASLEDVSRLHLFGTASEASNPVNVPITAPETRLRLTLHGVFASTDPSHSLAIIAEKNGKDKSYRRGDALPGGATLHEIYADRVILSRSGKLETLRLKTERIEQPATTRTPATRSTRPAQNLRQLKQQLKTNPQAVFRQVRLQPIMQNGRLQGYRLSHRDRRLMNQLGLLPQDVVTAINGTKVSDTTAMLALLRKVDELQMLQVSVLRNGRPRQLSISLK